MYFIFWCVLYLKLLKVNINVILSPPPGMGEWLQRVCNTKSSMRPPSSPINKKTCLETSLGMWPTVSSFPKIKAFIAQHCVSIFFDASFLSIFTELSQPVLTFFQTVFLKMWKPLEATFVWTKSFALRSSY